MNLLYQKLAPHCALQVRPSRDRSGEELTPRALYNRAADPLVTAGGFRQNRRRSRFCFPYLHKLTQTIAQVQVLFFHVTPDTCQVHVSRDQVSM